MEAIQTLKKILEGLEANVIGDPNIPIQNLRIDSRKVEKQDVFFALKGLQVDGHQFIEKAIDLGAAVIVCEKTTSSKRSDVTIVQVENTSIALGKMAAAFFDYPSKKMKLVGITGTNGKTTSAFLLYQFFKNLGHQCGLLSTIEYRIGDQVFESTHTTPDALQMQWRLKQMVEAECEYCFLEVSSHAVVQNRIVGVDFTGGVFTNISHDHLDYHHTFDEYIKAKKTFFDNLNDNGFALANFDDKRGKIMLQNTKADRHSFGIKTMADFRLKILENRIDGLVVQINNREIHTLLVGHFNALNLLGVFAVARLLGIEEEKAMTELSRLKAAEGRFELVKYGNTGPMGIIDYAHTPDALENVLNTLLELRKKGQLIITVVGCGGDRDKSKRPVMAKIASELSDKTILTSDNPRTEVPETIIEEMEQGLTTDSRKNALSITNRKQAIRTACQLAEEKDIILIAGKGHEKYQEINGERFPFDDKVELLNALKEQQQE